jgi:beta-galactosidase
LGEAAIGNAQLNAPGFPGGAGGPGGQGGAGAVGGQPNLAALFASIRLPFPWFNCYCGDIDLIGELKPQGYYRRVLWGHSKLEMAVQRPVPEGRTETISPWGWSDELRSWTWPGYEGKVLKVRAYTAGDRVRLLLNGKEIGVKPVSAATEMRAEFDVPYASGELKAIALENDRPVGELSFRTVGKPAKLRLKADRTSIRRDRNDLSYVTLEVLDAARGTWFPTR